MKILSSLPRKHLACAAVFIAVAAPAKADLLAALAPDAIVVVGDTAPAAERAAAAKMAARLRQVGGPADNLVGAEAINADLERAASHHLLVVGTVQSNRVMARVPSHWALDRDAYFATHAAFPDYTPTKGFYAAGYGTWTTGDVGYMEWDRNPYWHYATNLRSGGGIDNGEPLAPELPYRQIARFSGNSPAGVAAAVDAFLTRHLLTGVAAAADRLPDMFSLWTLDDAHFAAPETAPAWVPAHDMKDGNAALLFAGWHLADAMTYAGFEEIAQVPASAIWRVKYLTEKKWDYPMEVVKDPSHPMTRSPLFEATLARRASDNEWFVARLQSPAAAATAAKNLEAALSNKGDQTHRPWTEAPMGGVAWTRSRFGVHIAARGAHLVMESFDEAHEAMALRALSEKWAEAP